MAHTGMLRASCEANAIEIDPALVVDPSRPCNVEHCRELIEFADALLAQDPARLGAAREDLRTKAGDDGAMRAAAVVGNFQMMNRALDTIGATFADKLPSRVKALIEALGVAPPSHWPG